MTCSQSRTLSCCSPYLEVTMTNLCTSMEAHRRPWCLPGLGGCAARHATGPLHAQLAAPAWPGPASSELPPPAFDGRSSSGCALRLACQGQCTLALAHSCLREQETADLSGRQRHTISRAAADFCAQMDAIKEERSRALSSLLKV